MKIYTVVIFFCFIPESYAQAPKLKLMQGVWNYTMNTDTSNFYKVVSGKDCLDFGFLTSNVDSEFTLLEMVIGFQNSITKYDDTLFIHVDSLKEDGVFYTAIINKENITSEGIIDKAFCIIASYFECDGELLSINGGKLFEYEKISTLPFSALLRLYRRGKIDKRDYIKDYLKIKVLTIRNAKCKVYSNPSEPTNLQLKKDDIVVVIEDRGNWLKVQYDESGVGWIRKEDAN
jgi:hypothetical protein